MFLLCARKQFISPDAYTYASGGFFSLTCALSRYFSNEWQILFPLASLGAWAGGQGPEAVCTVLHNWVIEANGDG